MDENMTEDNYHSTARATILPTWLAEELPGVDQRRPIAHISFENNSFSVKAQNGSHTNYETIEQAYDYAHQELHSDVVLDESVDGHGGELMSGMFFCNGKSEINTSRMLISHTDEDTENVLRFQYHQWKNNLHPRYLENSQDWVRAYNWLLHHPAFWYRRDEKKTLHWITNNGLNSLYTSVYRSEGKTVVSLEHGTHVAPGYTQHYHDLRLDAYGETYEEAIVELAAKVNKFFNSDGTEKQGVEYDKSELELLLDERLAKVEEKLN